MPPRLRHNPELRDAIGIASRDAFDGMATRAISRQLTELEGQIAEIGGVHASLEGDSDQPLHGYLVELDDGTEIVLEVEIDPTTGQPIEEDQEFIDARNRLAVLRSRERSRGSRLFNFSFMKERGDGPGGHGYRLQGIDGIQQQYDYELSGFIARKIEQHDAIDDHDSTTQVMSRALVQEQEQMRVLEGMAAELKSGNRFLNYFRNRKGARVAVGGAALAGAAIGAPEIVVSELAVRAVAGGLGGYVVGRTAWDGFQGWRADRLPQDDIRMAGRNNGDFSGRITDPEVAFERFVKLNAAETRAGSHRRGRRELAHFLGATLVHEHYANAMHFAGPTDEKPDFDDLADQAWVLRQVIITPMEEERLVSDQTQSRRRHIAGLGGGLPGGTAAPAV